MVRIQYSLLEITLIKTGRDIRLPELKLSEDKYIRDWQIRVKNELEAIGCPKLIIVRAINNRYRFNKRLLYSHLYLYNLESLTDKVWVIIK